MAAPSKVAGVQLLDVSLRMLHTKKQAPWQRPLVSAFQRLLRETPLGKLFFGAIAKPAVSMRSGPCNTPKHAQHDLSLACSQLCSATSSVRLLSSMLWVCRASRACSKSATATRMQSQTSWWTAS